jgi:hypothetical protein
MTIAAAVGGVVELLEQSVLQLKMDLSHLCHCHWWVACSSSSSVAVFDDVERIIMS